MSQKYVGSVSQRVNNLEIERPRWVPAVMVLLPSSGLYATRAADIPNMALGAVDLYVDSLEVSRVSSLCWEIRYTGIWSDKPRTVEMLSDGPIQIWWPPAED